MVGGATSGQPLLLLPVNELACRRSTPTTRTHAHTLALKLSENRPTLKTWCPVPASLAATLETPVPIWLPILPNPVRSLAHLSWLPPARIRCFFLSHQQSFLIHPPPPPRKEESPLAIKRGLLGQKQKSPEEKENDKSLAFAFFSFLSCFWHSFLASSFLPSL